MARWKAGVEFLLSVIELLLFTVRRIKHCTSYGSSVVLSVCLSHAGTVSKRLHVARSSLHYWIAQEAQLPQRDCATPRTHFTRERRMDRWKDGQKAVARTRYAVCVTRKKGLRPKKPTEKIAGQRSYTVRGHRFWYQWGHQMQVFCITEEVNK